ncbi:MAG: DUF2069 domain-containing protein [Gammaproteobacteria bacterium]
MATPRLYHAVTLLGYFGILGLLVAWYGWLAPPRVFSPAAVILILALPLFAPLRGLLHGRPYTVAWSLFVSLIYFIHGVVEAYAAPDARWLALTEVALSLCWMIGGTLFIRSSKREAESSLEQQ